MSFEVNTGTIASALDGTEKLPISQGALPRVIPMSRLVYYDGNGLRAKYTIRIDTGGASSSLYFGDPSGLNAFLNYTPGSDLLDIAANSGSIKDVAFSHNVLSWTGTTVTLGGTSNPVTATFANADGLRILDTDGSHSLRIVPGSNLTANRTFTLTTGNVNRTLDISAANVTITAAGAALIDDADAPTQRTTLGVGTGDSPQFAGVNVGHATDSTITRVSAGVLAIEGANIIVSGGPGGTPSSLTLTNAAGLPLTTGVTGILPAANGGTGNGFTAFSGPASSTKTFTLPNASDTIACLGQAQSFSQTQTFATSVIASGGSGSAQINDRSTGTTDAWLLYASGGTLRVFQQNGLTDRITWGTNGLTVAGSVKPGSYTVGTVPSASTHGAGAMIYVSNESGGAVIAFSDGTNWKRVTDRATIS